MDLDARYRRLVDLIARLAVAEREAERALEDGDDSARTEAESRMMEIHAALAEQLGAGGG
jgi:hypothetical protein